MAKERKNIQRGCWSSNQGFILAAAGSAVGLGTIWKFPGKAYTGGGGIFCLLYLLVTLLLGLVLMLGEFAVGRAAQKNCVAAFRHLRKGWAWVGFLGVFSSLIVMLYYAEVGGWVLAYVIAYLREPELVFADPSAYFAELTGQGEGFPWEGALLFPLIFMLLTAFVLSGGVRGGIEKFNALAMPLLLLFLFVLAFATLSLPGAEEGLRFLFSVDFSKLNASTLLSALGQCFFSLSLGMSVMVTYGSYLSSGENLLRSVWAITGLDTLVAFLSAAIVVPAVFATPQISMGEGGSFTFTALATVFSGMPGGVYAGLLFYILLFFAALTSSVSLMEAIVSFLSEEWGLPRRLAIRSSTALIFLLGMAYTLSYGGSAAALPLRFFWFDSGGVYPVSLAEFIELLADRLAIPLAALASCLFVGWVWGTDSACREIRQQGKFSFSWAGLWSFLIKYLAPPAIACILLGGLFFGLSLS
ncbi:MAG: sodium-dependent transporter [Bacillota bacterium]|nr:sodium-dependent transporter [Bacillota bacterium]